MSFRGISVARNQDPPTPEPSTGCLWLRVFCVVAIVLLGGQCLILWVQMADERGLRKHIASREVLMRDAAMQACVTPHDLMAAAHAHGWDVQKQPTRIGGHLLHQNAPQTLRVRVKPPMPFAKIDDVIYQFGADGCLAPRDSRQPE